MSGLDYYKKVLFENYANFEGRARRSEYWYFVLFNIIAVFLLQMIVGLLSFILMDMLGSGLAFLPIGLLGIFYVAMIVPSLAVGVRRLHDTDKSGWMILLGLIPFIGSIILIVFFATEGTRGSNQYGPDPKEVQEDIIDNLV